MRHVDGATKPWTAKARQRKWKISKYEMLSGWKNVQQLISQQAGQNRHKDQNTDLIPQAKFLILRLNWFVDERFNVTIEQHHTDDFDDCVGEVELSEGISADGGKNDANKTREILDRMSRDIDMFMREYQALFPRGRTLGALSTYLERSMGKQCSK